MTVKYLCGMLTGETPVQIKNANDGSTMWEGIASDASFCANVEDWDFSNGHTIFVSGLDRDPSADLMRHAVKGMFVNENGCVPYAKAITQRIKPVETRGRNMLSALVGERVAVIRTRRGKAPTIVGYVTIYRSTHEPQRVMNSDYMRRLTLIPEGSAYDSGPSGKWCYWLTDAEECDPYPLPSSAVRHGRSWCEFFPPSAI